MRYTTIIDITELPAVWKNPNAVQLYLLMTLKSGYHDNDRDLYRASFRELSHRAGMTLSTVRHAIKVLEKENLVQRTGDFWTVTKWVASEEISKRPKNRRQAAEMEEARERNAQTKNRERILDEQRENRERLRARGKTPFMAYYEQQLEKAAKGDAQAQAIVEKHKTTYEYHKDQIEQEKNE